MNEFEVIQVKADLVRKGYHEFELLPGNNCVWASIKSGIARLDFYYIFRNGLIADIVID